MADRVCVITGASSGIGRAIARELSGPGTGITLIARREDKLQELAEELEKAGTSTLVEAHDVRDQSALQESVHRTAERFGRIDYAVANAGVSWRTEATDLNPKSVKESFEINVYGAFNLLVPALEVMLEQNHGQLVAVSSVASFYGIPGKGGYSASKAALAEMGECFRLDLSDEPVGVTTVYPGYVETPMIDHYPEDQLSFVVPVERAARRIVSAMKNKEKRCLFPWQMKILRAVSKIIPNWLFDTLVERVAAPMTDQSPEGPTDGE